MGEFLSRWGYLEDVTLIVNDEEINVGFAIARFAKVRQVAACVKKQEKHILDERYLEIFHINEGDTASDEKKMHKYIKGNNEINFEIQKFKKEFGNLCNTATGNTFCECCGKYGTHTAPLCPMNSCIDGNYSITCKLCGSHNHIEQYCSPSRETSPLQVSLFPNWTADKRFLISTERKVEETGYDKMVAMVKGKRTEIEDIKNSDAWKHWYQVIEDSWKECSVEQEDGSRVYDEDRLVIKSMLLLRHWVEKYKETYRRHTSCNYLLASISISARYDRRVKRMQQKADRRKSRIYPTMLPPADPLKTRLLTGKFLDISKVQQSAIKTEITDKWRTSVKDRTYFGQNYTYKPIKFTPDRDVSFAEDQKDDSSDEDSADDESYYSASEDDDDDPSKPKTNAKKKLDGSYMDNADVVEAERKWVEAERKLRTQNNQMKETVEGSVTFITEVMNINAENPELFKQLDDYVAYKTKLDEKLGNVTKLVTDAQNRLDYLILKAEEQRTELQKKEELDRKTQEKEHLIQIQQQIVAEEQEKMRQHDIISATERKMQEIAAKFQTLDESQIQSLTVVKNVVLGTVAQIIGSVGKTPDEVVRANIRAVAQDIKEMNIDDFTLLEWVQQAVGDTTPLTVVHFQSWFTDPKITLLV